MNEIAIHNANVLRAGFMLEEPIEETLEDEDDEEIEEDLED